MKNKIIIFGLALFINQTFAHAWGDLGHEVVGEIAEQILKNDEKTMQAIRSVIGVEPLAVAATWPDAMRDDDRFDDFSPYHFIVPTDSSKKQVEKDALTVLAKYPEILKDQKASREAKMIALRYIIHVVGDIHQPLHINANDFDFGGNACRVIWDPTDSGKGAQTNLHSLWDTGVVQAVALEFKNKDTSKTKYYGYKQVARALINKYDDIISAGKPSSIEEWVKNSVAVRDALAYPDQLPALERPYCQKEQNGKSIEYPVLGSVFANKAMGAVEKQMVLGGVHLAEYLKELFAKVQTNAPSEQTILQGLKVKND